MATVKRLINYYELNPSFDLGKNAKNVSTLLHEINKLNKASDQTRFKLSGNGYVCMHDIKFIPGKKYIRGRLLYIRMDVFPELINTKDTTIRDINAKAEEGVLESTHFLIDCSKNELIMPFEYNHYGPKITDMAYYIQEMGNRFNLKNHCTPVPIVEDNLGSFQKRIQRCSSFRVRVNKNDIQRIKKVNNDLWKALNEADSFGQSQYVELYLKFDYRSLTSTSKVNDLTFDLIKDFQKNPSDLNYFQHLEIKAEDSANNNRLKLFDLLSDKVQSHINIEKREKSRSLNSGDAFEKIEVEYLNQKF